MGNKAIKGKIGSDTCYFVPYFPVGSIYISVTNTNPSTIFGGTWERIQGKFLIGADDSTYKLGTTGGSSTHNHTNSRTGSTTLTVNQIPAHTHTLNGHTHTYNKSNATSGSTTLTIDQIPSHQHQVVIGSFANTGTENWNNKYNGHVTYNFDNNTNYNTRATGGGKGHTHSISTSSTNTGANSGNTSSVGGGTGHTHTMSATGSSSNIPPYLSVYIWKRTA